MKNIFKVLIGFLLVFIYRLPKLIFSGLQLSYAIVFNRQYNLTADPKEHLKRAKKLLKKNQNSLLLYAALELRFALERMVHIQLYFSKDASNNIMKEYDPVKKHKVMEKIDIDSKHPHDIYHTNKSTGKKYLFSEYIPLDLKQVDFIKGRLGDLLHPKDGLLLGVSNCDWYLETRKFLEESCEYLSNIAKKNDYFFVYKDNKNFELVKKQ